LSNPLPHIQRSRRSGHLTEHLIVIQEKMLASWWNGRTNIA